MITTEEALLKGYSPQINTQSGLFIAAWSFKFGDNNEYELCFEPLLWEKQMYVALYKNQELLTEKVVVKPGYVKQQNPKNKQSNVDLE